MTQDALALIACLLTWIASAFVALRILPVVIRDLPASWRTHPELQAGYSAALNTGFGRVLKSPRGIAWFLLPLTALFAGMTADEFSLRSELVFALIVATYGAGSNIDQQRRQRDAVIARYDLPRVPRQHPALIRALQVCIWVGWLGIVGACCFAGRVIADAF